MRWIGAVLTLGLLIVPSAALAQQTVNYGWEDGTGTILGSYGNVANPTNITVPVHSGSHALQVTESPEGATPQAYVAYITNLTENDVVSASFWAYDTPDASHPSMRIWAHYATNSDIDTYMGSAGEGTGNTGYTTGIGWEQVSSSWTIPAGQEALVIELRLYSPTGTTPDFVIDDLSVTAPATATVNTPAGGLPPAAEYGFAMTQMNTNKTITLVANGDNTPFDYFIDTLPANGTLWDGATQITSGALPYDLSSDSVSYHPNAAYSGLDSFEFYAVDAAPLTSDNALVEVAVQSDKVAISEVMHTPTIGYNSSTFPYNTYQYVEIYNYSASAVSLTALDAYYAGSTDTAGNLTTNGAVSIPSGEMRILAVTYASAPELDEDFRCSWGLPEADIIRIPSGRYEYLTSSSRILLFGDGELLDAVDLGQDGSGSGLCSGNSYAYYTDGGSYPLDTLENDNDAGWDCASNLDGVETSSKGDFGSPGYIDDIGFISTDVECFGACCLPDGSCVEGLTEDQCLIDNCGEDFSIGTECSAMTCTPVDAKKCCLPIGTCLDLGECECLQVGGLWDDNTTCGVDPYCDILVDVVINELEYAVPGTDYAEYIELYGTPDTALEGWTIELHNGNANTSGYTLYTTIDLGASLTAMPSDGYLVVGTAVVPNVDVLLPFESNNIQNGGGCGANGCGDGIALFYNGIFVEGFSYDTTTDGFAARGGDADGMFLSDMGLVDTDDTTLQKINDGEVWTVTYNNTPGEYNYDMGPRGACCMGEACTVEYASDCATMGGEYLGDDTDCEGFPCVPRGACCKPDGTCEGNLTEAECLAIGGSWNGEDTLCPDYDAFEACLAGPGAGLGASCEAWDYDEDIDVDLADFAVFQENVCIPDPVGACCKPNGECEETQEVVCENVYFGVFRGEGVECEGLDPECEQPQASSLVINEIMSSENGKDRNEFIEIFNGDVAAADLTGVSLIIVDGDTGGNPDSTNFQKVNLWLDLSSMGSLAAGDYLTIGISSNGLFTPDVSTEAILAAGFDPYSVNTNGEPDDIQNGSQTYALVDTALVATSNGILTASSMAAISSGAIDLVATIDDANDHYYFLAPVVFTESGAGFDYAQRIPNGVDTNLADDWEGLTDYDFNVMGDPADPSTPDAANSSITLIPGGCCEGTACSVVTEAVCDAAGGTFLGYGSDCGPPNPCDCNTVAEARAAGTGVEILLCDVVVSSTYDLISSPSNKTIHVQDATGGLTVFGTNAVIDPLLALVAEGYQIDLGGVTATYYGLFELAAPFTTPNVDGAVGVPAPAATTIADYQDGSATAEGFESELVKLEGVQFVETGTFAYGNYHVWTGSGDQVIVRVATGDLDLVGQPIPTSSGTVIGIFTQYDNAAPYDGGYQLMPRTMSDIVFP